MLKAVIFDCDGVLVDSREANIALYQNLLVRAGYQRPSRQDVLNCFHLPLRESIIDFTGLSDEAEIARILDLVEEEGIRDNSLFRFSPHLESVLKTLNEKYKLGIATSRIESGINDVLGEVNVRKYFSAIVVNGHYKNPKPHPEPLLLAAERLGIKPYEAVYVGDSHVDIIAAKAAGMKSIHLSKTIHKDADMGITDIVEVPEAVSQLDLINTVS